MLNSVQGHVKNVEEEFAHNAQKILFSEEENVFLMFPVTLIVTSVRLELTRQIVAIVKNVKTIVQLVQGILVKNVMMATTAKMETVKLVLETVQFVLMK